MSYNRTWLLSFIIFQSLARNTILSRRAAIIELHKNGHLNSEIVKSLKKNKMFVSRTISRFLDTGSIQDRSRKGRKRTVRTSTLRKNVKLRLSRNPVRSMRKLAKEMNIARESMRLLVRNELGMSSYKFQKKQLLSVKNREKRLKRCRSLLGRFTGGLQNQILFSDEKLFVVEQQINKQNDRILATNKESLPPSSFRVSRTQKPASVMVCAGVTSDGRTPLVFIPQGVKINQSIYRESILESVLKPWVQKHFGSWPWTFQQDSAPAHRARATQE